MRSSSYAVSSCSCKADCIYLDANEAQPCWGEVVVIDEVEWDDDDWAWVHVCYGHREYYYSGKYEREQ